MRKLIVLTGTNFSDGTIERDILAAADADLRVVDCKTEAELMRAAEGASGLLVTSSTPVGARSLRALSCLEIIVRCGIGVDNVDIRVARERGIRVCVVPDYCTDEVADHTMALLLACERKIVQQSAAVRAGRWEGVQGIVPVGGLRGRVLGLVGLGSIGRGVCARAMTFGLTAIAHDPYLGLGTAESMHVPLVSLDELLQGADFVSLHAPLTDGTYHMIDGSALRKMKPSAYLINTARGPLVDRKALLDALCGGRLAGAALDVVEDELAGTTELRRLPNVIFTPHVAWFSERSERELRQRSAQEVARYLRGEPLQNPVL